MSGAGWTVTIVIACIWIAYTIFRKSICGSYCKKIQAGLVYPASAKLEYWNFGTGDSYPTVIIKCDPDVREWIKKLGIDSERCSLICDFHFRTETVGIIPTTEQGIKTLAKETSNKGTEVKSWAYMLRKGDGLVIVFLWLDFPEYIQDIRFQFWGKKLAQIPITRN